MNTDKILILDFGGVQAQSTARKLRGECIFCEILPGDTSARTVEAQNPRGIVLAGGAGEPYRSGPDCDAALFSLGVPVLAMGYAARLMAVKLGGAALGTLLEAHTAQITFTDSQLFDGLSESDRFFERVDTVELPEGFSPIAYASGGVIPAFAAEDRRLYGMQFYAETNDPDGLQILSNFAVNICGCEAWWSMDAFVEQETQAIREAVKEGDALIAISGGVDSSVCAALMHRALGDRLKCLYIDTGLMRQGETRLVTSVFRDGFGMDLIVVDASARVLDRLQGVTDPGEKRRVVDEEVLRVFREESDALGNISCLARGTIYPDVLAGEVSVEAASGYRIIEPLRLLFKDEVRKLGEVLEVPKDLISRQPFPAPGLAVRIAGEVTPGKLELLRAADAIFRAEIADAGLDRRIWMYFALLTDLKTNGMRDGVPCREYAVALRAVSSQDALSAMAYRLPYDLLERVTQRITSEVPNVNRVLYDVTGRPAMIEWG